jgi:hypothetical protein
MTGSFDRVIGILSFPYRPRSSPYTQDFDAEAGQYAGSYQIDRRA